MKILIAEDDLVTREMLKRVLGHLADEIVEAGDGLEALEKLESENPDFLLTDLQMPELDGRALVEAVRASKAHRQLPVVCMSAVKDKEQITALVALGIQDYILKPIRSAEVQERFAKVIEQHSGWRRRQVVEGRRTLMLVDPDPEFRQFCKPLLEGDFAILEATSGAHALRIFKESELKPTVVVVAKGLPLVGEVQLCSFIEKLATGMQVSVPQFWLCAERDLTRQSVASAFRGHIQRTMDPQAFADELARTLLRGTTPAEKITEFLHDSGATWLAAATRQTLGVMSGQDVNTVRCDAPLAIVHGVASRFSLLSSDIRVTIVIACARDHAVGLASQVSKRPASVEDSEATVFEELSNAVGGRVRAALAERGFVTEPSKPVFDADYSTEPGGAWEVTRCFEIDAGIRFFVGMSAEAASPTEENGQASG
ncbi:MAG: response regulator [Gemmatimonadaceae bacterium]